jgi:hypothetical protein
MHVNLGSKVAHNDQIFCSSVNWFWGSFVIYLRQVIFCVHNAFDLLFMMYPFPIYFIGMMILFIVLNLAPLELIHHVMLTITHKGEPKRLLKALLCSLQSDILIAEDLREEGTEVTALHKGLVFPAQLFL